MSPRRAADATGGDGRRHDTPASRTTCAAYPRQTGDDTHDTTTRTAGALYAAARAPRRRASPSLATVDGSRSALHAGDVRVDVIPSAVLNILASDVDHGWVSHPNATEGVNKGSSGDVCRLHALPMGRRAHVGVTQLRRSRPQVPDVFCFDKQRRPALEIDRDGGRLRCLGLWVSAVERAGFARGNFPHATVLEVLSFLRVEYTSPGSELALSSPHAHVPDAMLLRLGRSGRGAEDDGRRRCRFPTQTSPLCVRCLAPLDEGRVALKPRRVRPRLRQGRMSTMTDYVPLIQTTLWVFLIAGILFVWRKHWSGILGGVRDRIDRGDPVKFGIGFLSAELKSESEGSPRLEPKDQLARAAAPTDSTLETRRQKIGKDQRGVHLVHVATPSAEPGQAYDLFVYLAAGLHRDVNGLPVDLSDVQTAEFHVGPKFTPSGVVVSNHGDKIGFATSAYGPVLCVCRVTFSDGHEVILQRYLDFESAELARRAVR